ncbi:MAG: HPr family phosphocarrier protein [Clostridia bacterium]|nr:HPr family phosphocarrier protein [Clostridia bacterium]
MIKYDIRLTLAENVKTFVNIINKYDFDMDLRAGRHVVDAKSILGIFSLDLSRTITLEIEDADKADPEVLKALEADIQPFLA